jgi:hypothetical protein
MSIFEPIPREPRWDEDTQELDEARWEDGSAPTAGFDPRSITIAGLVVIAIVIAGLVASNAADPASRPQPLVPARVNPGAAAVEQVEAKQSAPDPSASPSVKSTDEGDDDAPRWQAPNDSSDDFAPSRDSKWDSKPGKGHGHGRG